MALHGEVRVNGMTIGGWEVQRATFLDREPEADDLVVYRYMVRQDSTLQGNEAVLSRGQVVHRFGDGAVALIAEVYAAVAEEVRP